ncbi:hypothetical protein SAMN02910435_01124 [Ruminococcaceae bacterium D5]|jgi:hypothetical protein|nr:hypothetical protein SAMN02910435_01124 [Ruminococcaceae bacterium D5]
METITPEEAVKLARHKTIGDMATAISIAKASGLQPSMFRGDVCVSMAAITNVWLAGRVQGIREERAKRRAALTP